MVVLFLLFSCKDPPNLDVSSTESLLDLSGAAMLARASLDIRGVRPALEELDRIEADPSVYDALVDGFLQDSRFGDRIRRIYSEVYNTETDFYGVNPTLYGIEDDAAFVSAVGQEPLRIIQEVATSDLPWTDIVTADWTMANEISAQAFLLNYPPNSSGWQRATYTDGRPMSGVLSTNGMWMRYSSTVSNMNRTRANALSRLTLCHDYLSRPIEFSRDLDLLDEEATNAAIKNDPACINCHNSLDPLAAHFFGFWAPQLQSFLEVSRYHVERENLWEPLLQVEPAYFGSPSRGLSDLGQHIASDPRFSTCVVKQVMGALLQRNMDGLDLTAIMKHREVFIENGMTMRALFKSVMEDADYRGGPGNVDEKIADVKMLNPDQLVASIYDLTGFQWVYSGYPMLQNDQIGLQTLAGSADGQTVAANATAPNPTMILVHARIAELASFFAVDREMAMVTSERTLFRHLDPNQHFDEDIEASISQIRHLHRRILSRSIAVDGPEVEANRRLWAELYDISGDSTAAWAGVVAVLLRDPNFLLY